MPSLPSLPSLPSMPSLPSLPSLPSMPSVSVPSASSVLEAARSAALSSGAGAALSGAGELGSSAQSEAARAASRASAAAGGAAADASAALEAQLGAAKALADAATSAVDAGVAALGGAAQAQAARLASSAEQALPPPVAAVLRAAAQDQAYAARLAAATLGAPLVLLLALRSYLYGGYAGDLSPEQVQALLQTEARALLVDLRTAEARAQDGTPDLRRGARTKGQLLALEALPSAVRGLVRDPKALELARLALRCRALSAPRGRVVLLDSGAGEARALARALTQLGGRRAYTLRGGFSAWKAAGLAVKQKPDYGVNSLAAATEELVDAATEAVLTSGAVATETLSNPQRLAGLGAAAAGVAAAALNWELVLEEIAVLGLFASAASKLLSYESLDELTMDLAKGAKGAAQLAAKSAGAAGSLTSKLAQKAQKQQ